MEKKRSFKYLIISACLALLLVSIAGVIAGANTPVTVDENLKLKGASLDLNDKIAIAFAIEKANVVDEDGNVAYSLYLYDTNPGATAAAGTEVSSYITQTIGGTEYVLYITEGFAAPDYKNTVYARVANVENNEYGPVVKTGVLELAYGMKAKFDAKLAADAENETYKTRVNLFNSIIEYGISADLVVNEATEYDYSYITVSDGYIDDGNGGKWTAGVYQNGTELNLVNSASDLKYYTAYGVVNSGWTNGNTASDGSVYTVNGTANLSPLFVQDMLNTNPTTTRWYIAGRTNIVYTWNQLASAVKGLNDLTTAWKGTETSSVGRAITRGISVNENGEAVVTYEFNHKTFTAKQQLTDSQAVTYVKTNHADVFGSSGYGLQEDPQVFRYTNNSVAGSPFTMSFDILFPGTDKNGNGVKYEAGVYSTYDENEAVLDADGNPTYDENDEPVTGVWTTKNGDMFIMRRNDTMLRIPVRFSTSDITTVYYAMYVHLNAVIEGGKVTGFKVQTIGSSDPNTGGTNGVTYDKVYDITEWHNMQFRVTPSAEGKLDKIEVIVDNEVIATHLASNGEAKYGLEQTAIDNVVLTGDSKLANAEYSVQSLGSFNGDVQMKNPYGDFSTALTADQIRAGALYNATAAGYTENVQILDYSTGTQAHVAWNTLNSTAGAGVFGTFTPSANNATNGSWRYDAETDSVIYSKFVAETADSANAGLFTILVDNPLYGKSADWVEGQTLVFEYTQSFGTVDYDGDGLLSEWSNSLGDANDVSARNTSVQGFMNIGYGDGVGTVTQDFSGVGGIAKATISDTNSLFAGIRYDNQRSTQSYHVVTPVYKSNTSDTGATALQGITYGGNAVTFRYELKIGEGGVPTELKIYANGVLKTTRTNAESTDGKTNMSSWTSAFTPVLTADIFAAPYIEICYGAQRHSRCTTSFSDIHAWYQVNN